MLENIELRILVIRADATPLTGAGHAMRCLNLAEAWVRQRRGSAALVGEITIGFVIERARRLGVRIHAPSDWPEGQVLVVDSYDEDVRIATASLGSFVRRVLVDDLGESVPSGFHMVWNPNAYGSESLYPQFQGAVVTGPRAVPLNPELPPWRGRGSKRIGIALGGGSIAPVLVELLSRLATLFPSYSFGGVGDWVPQHWERFSSHDPWGGFAGCDRVLIAGGTMTWEAAQVGIPAVVLQTAANQELVVNWARLQGVPTVDVRHPDDSADRILVDLQNSLVQARPLPRIDGSADWVASRMFESLPATAR